MNSKELSNISNVTFLSRIFVKNILEKKIYFVAFTCKARWVTLSCFDGHILLVHVGFFPMSHNTNFATRTRERSFVSKRTIPFHRPVHRHQGWVRAPDGCVLRPLGGALWGCHHYTPCRWTASAVGLVPDPEPHFHEAQLCSETLVHL